jgi:hypothetical protein
MNKSLYNGVVEEAYQTVCYGFSEPDEMRMNGDTSKKIMEGYPEEIMFNKYQNASVVIDDTLPDGEIVFVNNNIKNNPPTHLGKIEEKHWMSKVTI